MGELTFGRRIREQAFSFDTSYIPLNHGSYGAFPKPVRAWQRDLQDQTEARSDPFIRFTIPKLLRESRQAVAPLLGVSSKEVVFTPNATTGINTVLRNLAFSLGDVILYFSTAYGACEKTILHVCEVTPAESVRIDVEFPLEDDELIRLFRQTVGQLIKQQKRVRIAMFDTVPTWPGVRLPWERLVGACRDLKILSLIDGAHGIGHIDLERLGQVDPDFFTSNCYKWLYTPRGCAIFYVPFRNQHLIRTTFPTSHGFKPLDSSGTWSQRSEQEASDDSLGDLFAWAATIDMSPYLCVTEALKFRSDICGGEKHIRDYCFDLARSGGRLMANILQTEVMENKTRTSSECCFTMVRLPLRFQNDELNGDIPSIRETPGQSILASEKGAAIVKWMMDRLRIDHNTWIPAKFYQGAVWVRVSAQIYLELKDFERAAQILSGLCEQVQAGEGP